MRILFRFSLGVLAAAAACGQAVVEHAIITAGSSAAAAGSKDAGKSVGGVFRNLNETLDKAGKTEKPGARPAADTARSVSPQPEPAPKPVARPRVLVDPAEITEGLSRAELIDRFGAPLLSVTESNSAQFVEKMWYPTKFDQIDRRLDGKVAPREKQKRKNDSAALTKLQSSAKCGVVYPVERFLKGELPLPLL